MDDEFVVVDNRRFAFRLRFGALAVNGTACFVLSVIHPRRRHALVGARPCGCPGAGWGTPSLPTSSTRALVLTSMGVRTAVVAGNDFMMVDTGSFASMLRFRALAGLAYPAPHRGSHKGVPLRVRSGFAPPLSFGHFPRKRGQP